MECLALWCSLGAKRSTDLAAGARFAGRGARGATSPRTNYRNPVVLRFTGSAGSGCRHGLQRPWLVAPGRPARGEAKNWRGKSARRAAALDSKGLPAGPRTRPRGPQHSPRSPARAHRAGREGPCQISRPTARFSPETASRRETRTTHRLGSHGPLPLSSVLNRPRPHVERCPTLRWPDRLETAPKKPIVWLFAWFLAVFSARGSPIAAAFSATRSPAARAHGVH